MVLSPADAGILHHLEIWVEDLDRAALSWGWLLGELGFIPETPWGDPPRGVIWRHPEFYLVLEASPTVTGGHDRLRAGLNHLAFSVAGTAEVDRLARQAPDHGWMLMFTESHPHAGGPDHYAAYLENADGFEVELVARNG
ncbi:VOC family protein [Psychromicrobium xiongbiense]|uniref:VOC family protein n=1 Tax=Psychromicrobium xiongbiense TaxID=3051184 RepID=UPI002557BA38|nr:VOC family protein [Psychromicrobium sp. YIM S02556]